MSAFIVFALLFLGVVCLLSYLPTWWGERHKPCSKCHKNGPLKWCPIFNCWLCYTCLDTEVDRSTDRLMIEIRNRL